MRGKGRDDSAWLSTQHVVQLIWLVARAFDMQVEREREGERLGWWCPID